MQLETEVAQPLSKRQLAMLTAGALLAATVILVLFVLPAEYRMDPTGFGRASGLMRLAAPKSGASKSVALEAPAENSFARYYASAYRTDVIDIPLAAAGAASGGDELEYKVRLRTGESLIYSWSLQDGVPAEQFYFDFHGETPASAEHPEAKVLEYKQTTGTSSNGVLVAPIDGVHGWYFQNQSARPVVVHLEISGFYTLVRPGEYGNEGGIVPIPRLQEQGGGLRRLFPLNHR